MHLLKLWLIRSRALVLRHRWWFFAGTLVVTATLAVALSLRANRQTPDVGVKTEAPKAELSDAEKAGRMLSANKCEGKGVPAKLSVSPMKAADFKIIIPYGLMVGGHVTPIDHQYFSPAGYNSPRDAYEVRAMADGRITEITERINPNPGNQGGNEYRIIFAQSCTFLYYYDLVTSLSPEIASEFKKGSSTNIKVKAGQVIGRIGGRTLDFAVWDTTKPLKGFLVPEHYKTESWKLYTADPLDYYTDELRAFALSRYVRTAAPISGKIDYDVDGKLIGNWFQEGTNGYEGIREGNNFLGYWKSHLSFSPDHWDPTRFVISIGSLWQVVQNEADMQYMSLANAPDPATVGVDSGLVKYQLVKWSYTTASGQSWDNTSHVSGGVRARLSTQSPSYGCAAVKLVEARKLKFEVFRGRSCSGVSDFTSAAKVYER